MNRLGKKQQSAHIITGFSETKCDNVAVSVTVIKKKEANCRPPKRRCCNARVTLRTHSLDARWSRLWHLGLTTFRLDRVRKIARHVQCTCTFYKAHVTVISQRYVHAVHLTLVRRRPFFLARKRGDPEWSRTVLCSNKNGGDLRRCIHLRIVWGGGFP